MRHIRHFIRLESDCNQTQVDFETGRGEMVALHVVQYETKID